jgi:hypothetical protein
VQKNMLETVDESVVQSPIPALPRAVPEDLELELVPPVAESIEETGLTDAVIEQIILKLLHFRGEIMGRDLASALGLKFSVIDPLMDKLKQQQLVQVKRSLAMGSMTAMFALGDAGRNLALQYLEVNQYTGPAPVPLFQYTYFVRRQRAKDGWLTKDMLAFAYRRMVVTPRILSQIGPAVSSGNSFLIYGRPGNGKTYLAEALANLDKTCIYMPYAIEYQGTIIQIFDPTYHQVINDAESTSAISFESPYDGRWFKCRRPFIVSGGELSLEMLDLSYNATSKIYDAPFQLKANNGIYLIDDFGRQKATPAEVLNRWIVPMERHVDYLSFHSGGKMTVPFEAFLVFSTNLQPDQLGDEAFLRRIQYKMLLANPDEGEFRKIFTSFCEAKELGCPGDLIAAFIARHYRAAGKQFRRCHPRDVISHAIDIINFEKLPYQLTDDLLEAAFESCFLSGEEGNV